MNEQEALEQQEEAQETPAAPLSPEQELDQRRAELDALRQELAQGWSILNRERRLDMLGHELEKRGMAAGFADFLLRDTDEESLTAVEQFEALFRESLTHAITQRMRGGLPPREPKKSRGYRRGDLGSLSRSEINAHWDEIMQSLTD